MDNQNDMNLISGVGVGLRGCHYQHILQYKPDIPWFEALSDNYMVDGGPALNYLMAIRKDYPMVMHGVGMSLGSTDPLKRLKELMLQLEPAWVSEHLSWVSVNGQYFHDLLPLPYTQEVIDHLASRIQQVQDYLGQTILIENASTYFEYEGSEMTEIEFVSALLNKTDCNLLLDINNLYVSAENHQFSTEEYLNKIPIERVKQMHLAGYADKSRFLFDNHGHMIHQPVWDLYSKAIERFGQVPTLIEWDDNIPPFTVLLGEAKKAQQIMDKFNDNTETITTEFSKGILTS